MPFFSHSDCLLKGTALIAVISLLASCSEPAPVRERAVKPVRIMEVGETFIAAREFYGTAGASRTADLSFRFGGRIAELPVAEGDRIMSGTMIASLDAREWEAQERQVASELDAARAVLEQMRRGAREEDVQRLEAVAAARRAEATEAVAQFGRIETLHADGAVSNTELDKSRLAMVIANSSADAAELELRIAKSGARSEEVEAKQAEIRGLESRLQEARDNLKDTVLTAPFDGIISRVNVSAFEAIQGNQPVATLQDLGLIDVVIHVTEADMGESHRATPDPELRTRTVGFAEFPALMNRRFPVRIKEFQTQADPTTQTYKVILQLQQDASFPVKPGMNAVVRGEGAQSDVGDGGYLVPITAVWGGAQGENFVWVVDSGSSKVSRRKVTPGEIVGESIVITEGLEAGERIAVTAANLLREGMQVEQLRDLGAL